MPDLHNGRTDCNFPDCNCHGFEKKITEPGNDKAVRIEGHENNNASNIRILEYLLLHNDEPYVIRYIASMDDFERNLPAFELMVESFAFGTNATDSKQT